LQVTHQVQLQNQQLYTEVSDHIMQGSAYYSTADVSPLIPSLENVLSPSSQLDGATFQTGQDTVVRAQFLNNGALANSQDGNFRAASNDWPVFALSHDLGTVDTVPSRTLVYSIGHSRDPSIVMRRPGNVMQARSSYFWTQYSDIHAVVCSSRLVRWSHKVDADLQISDFLNDYTNALSRANTLDAQVQSDAGKISTNYAGLAALSLRQALGATEITVSKVCLTVFFGQRQGLMAFSDLVWRLEHERCPHVHEGDLFRRSMCSHVCDLRC
jgi:hypothetical protein